MTSAAVIAPGSDLVAVCCSVRFHSPLAESGGCAPVIELSEMSLSYMHRFGQAKSMSGIGRSPRLCTETQPPNAGFSVSITWVRSECAGQMRGLRLVCHLVFEIFRDALAVIPAGSRCRPAKNAPVSLAVIQHLMLALTSVALSMASVSTRRKMHACSFVRIWRWAASAIGIVAEVATGD